MKMALFLLDLNVMWICTCGTKRKMGVEGSWRGGGLRTPPQFRECPHFLGSVLGPQPLRCGMCVIMEMQGLITGGI